MDKTPLQDVAGVRAIADRWSLSEEAVRRMVKAGKLPAFRVGGHGAYRVLRSEIEAYEARTVAA